VDSPVLLNGRGLVDMVDGWAHMSGMLTVANGWKRNGMTWRVKKVKVDDTQVRRNFLVAHRLQETFLMTYR
jgi:hypothetical protein